MFPWKPAEGAFLVSSSHCSASLQVSGNLSAQLWDSSGCIYYYISFILYHYFLIQPYLYGVMSFPVPAIPLVNYYICIDPTYSISSHFEELGN